MMIKSLLKQFSLTTMFQIYISICCSYVYCSLLQHHLLSSGKTFLFEVSYNCDLNVLHQNCFNFTSDGTRNLIDCSDSDADQVDVICFRLIFDWITGLQEAGGIFSLSSVLLAVISWFMLKFTLSMIEWCALVIFVQFFLALTGPTFLMVVNKNLIITDYFNKVYLLDINLFCTLLQLSIVSLFAFLTPWCFFRKVEDEDA